MCQGITSFRCEASIAIGNGETVDLAIIGKNKRIAVEIETGKSDAIHNIRKCLDAGFEVVSMATSEETLERIKSRLVEFSEAELQRTRTQMIKRNW